MLFPVDGSVFISHNKIQKIISNLTACPGIIQDSDSSDV